MKCMSSFLILPQPTIHPPTVKPPRGNCVCNFRSELSVHSTWIPENCHHAISAPLLGRPWRTLRLSWPLWWAVGPQEPCWPGPSSSLCITVQIPAPRTGRSSSRTRQRRASGRWASVGVKVPFMRTSTGYGGKAFVFKAKHGRNSSLHSERKSEREEGIEGGKGRWETDSQTLAPECFIYWLVSTKQVMASQ